MPQPRVVLPGSRKEPLRGAEPLGPADPSSEAQVTVIVRRDKEPLPITGFGVVADRQRYIADHGANANDLLAVRNFAKEYGLTVLSANAATRSVELAGKVDALSRAFGVTLKKVRLDGQLYRVRDGEITIPADLAGTVQAVLGLDNRRAADPRFRKISAAKIQESARGAALSPVEAARLYDFPSNLNGAGQSVAIIELDGGLLPSDLTSFLRQLNLPAPPLRVVLLDGQTNAVNRHLPEHPELNADEEVALDVQMAAAIAPKAAQTIYFAQNNDQSFLKAVNAAIHATPRPAAISISWGAAESQCADQFKVSFEQALQDAANLGITVCVASGDNGSPPDSGSSMVDFPASAPHALACGGTSLRRGSGQDPSESVWSSVAEDRRGRSMRIGSGGGVSTFFNKPIYQAALNVPPRLSGTGEGRGVPDVCGNADPLTGYRIRVKGKDVIVGGTSAVAPLWAALIARMAQGLKRPVGFLHPKLYTSKVRQDVFQKIANGDSVSEGVGVWNPRTGLGSPKGGALLKTLAGIKPAPSPIRAQTQSQAKPQLPTPPKAAGPKPLPAPAPARLVARPAKPLPPAARPAPRKSVPLRPAPQQAKPVRRTAPLVALPRLPAPAPPPATRVPLRPPNWVLPVVVKASVPAKVVSTVSRTAIPNRTRALNEADALSSVAGLVAAMGVMTAAGIVAVAALGEDRR